MKKAYTTPSIQVYDINGAQIMAAASIGLGNDANNLGNAESYKDSYFFDDDDDDLAGW